MTFQPVLPSTGISGWRFLQRTYETQLATFNKAPVLSRDAEYFLENIGDIRTAEELVSDRRLLTVALGAFGLQDDINNKYLIQRILEDGTTDRKALANRLSDERYKKLSAAFGFGPAEFQTTGLKFRMEEIVSNFKIQSFEVAVGEQDDSMRVALFAQRELPKIASGEQSNDSRWYKVLGQPPLRKLFERALGMPSQVINLDIDQQLSIFKDRAQSIFGSDDLSTFNDPELLGKITDQYLLREQAAAFSSGSSSASIALQLLSS